MRLPVLALGLLLAPFLVSGPASAGCIDYGDYLHRDGAADLRSACLGLDVSGNYACAVEGLSWRGLEVIDVTNSEAPFVVGALPLPRPQDVFMSGPYAFVTDHPYGFEVISIADPGNPQIVGQIGTPGQALTMVDDFSRESPAIEADFSLGTERVIRVLEQLREEGRRDPALH
jgi:hypothetical protein